METQQQQISTELAARQAALEEEMRGTGQAKYIAMLQKRDEADLLPGDVLLLKSVKPLADRLDKWVNDIQQGAAKSGAMVAWIVEKAGAIPCAFLGMRALINSAMRDTELQTIAKRIGGEINKHLKYAEFEAEHPNLAYWIQQQLAHCSPSAYSEAVVSHAERTNHIFDVLDSQNALEVGVKVIDFAIETSGLFDKITSQEGVKKKVNYVVGTPKIRQWLKDQHGKLSLLSPEYLPMLVPPKPWTTPINGGYYSIHMAMVKGGNKNYLEDLKGVMENRQWAQLPTVYDSLNAIQGTAWRINGGILRVMTKLWDMGGGKAGMPEREARVLPHKPIDIDTNPESLKKWRGAAKAVHGWNHRNQRDVLSMAQKLLVGEKFKNEERIYFVHTIDFRGREYPVATGVSPQGNDSSKALLEFAEGKPLGADGVKWLAIHLANTYGLDGIDKASFEERIQWTKEHSDMIKGCWYYPFTNTEWMEADSPFCFLAACREWALQAIHGNEWLSHLPVMVDGSCNGLQHFSAMLLDEVGGKATNLVPSDKPQDIYGLVAEEANRLIEEDYQKSECVGIAEVFINNQGGLPRGKITRKLTKRNTMTMPYSATLYGMKGQLIEEFQKLRDAGEPWDFKGYSEGECATYLAGVNYKALGGVVIAARGAMEWLKKVLSVAESGEIEPDGTKLGGIPINWRSPFGFPVQQYYKKYEKAKPIRITFRGKQTSFSLPSEVFSLDRKAQSYGTAPNFVHSCDAAHLMSTAIKAKEAGIHSLWFIHDCYGTHACDMTELARLLREAFIEQYSGDVLGRFRGEVVEQLREVGREDLIKKIPPVPPKGTLNIEAVRDSKYFFA
jgi:DNA-directed RNA polymerase